MRHRRRACNRAPVRPSVLGKRFPFDKASIAAGTGRHESRTVHTDRRGAPTRTTHPRPSPAAPQRRVRQVWSPRTSCRRRGIVLAEPAFGGVVLVQLPVAVMCRHPASARSRTSASVLSRHAMFTADVGYLRARCTTPGGCRLPAQTPGSRLLVHRPRRGATP